MAVCKLSIVSSVISADAISISRVIGFDSTKAGIESNTTVRFYFNYEVGAFDLIGLFNPFEFSTPDSAFWQPLTGEILPPLFEPQFDHLHLIFLSVTGYDADTAGILAHSPLQGGLPSGFNEEIIYFETRFDENQVGKHICIDTVSGGQYISQWITSGDTIQPDWGGPYCFEIVDCCEGLRGDVSGDGTGPNIVDAARLVDHVFRGMPLPACPFEADLNSDGINGNLLDINFIINYIHRNGPLPGPCP